MLLKIKRASHYIMKMHAYRCFKSISMLQSFPFISGCMRENLASCGILLPHKFPQTSPKVKRNTLPQKFNGD